MTRIPTPSMDSGPCIIAQSDAVGEAEPAAGAWLLCDHSCCANALIKRTISECAAVLGSPIWATP